jgi:hypothetical protein
VWVWALERDIVAVPRFRGARGRFQRFSPAGSWVGGHYERVVGRSRTSMDELLSSAGST